MQRKACKSPTIFLSFSCLVFSLAFALCIFYITVFNNCHPLPFFLCVLEEILFIPKMSFSGIKSVLWYFSYGFKFCHCNFIFKFFLFKFIQFPFISSISCLYVKIHVKCFEWHLVQSKRSINVKYYCY